MTSQTKLNSTAGFYERKGTALQSLSHRLENVAQDANREDVDEHRFSTDWGAHPTGEGVVSYVEVRVTVHSPSEMNFIEHLFNHGFTSEAVETDDETTVVLRDERLFDQ